MQTSSTSNRCDVIVRGGGAVGATLSLLLAHAGFEVALVERAGAQPLDEGKDPRAYALNANSQALLVSVRAWPRESACAVYGMRIRGDAGGEVGFSAWRQQVGELAHIVPAVALDRALEQALRFQPRVSRFAEGDRLPEGTLVAICEGRDSTTRALFGLSLRGDRYGHRGVAARIVCERTHDHVARQWFSGADVLALLPLPDNDAHAVSLVWSLPEARAREVLAMPEDEVTALLEAATGRELGSMTLDTPLVAWDLRHAWAPRLFGWHDGQAGVLVGDAAHAVHPLAGQGLNLGLADAAELAHVLSSRESWRRLDDNRLLRRYERSRQAAALAVGGTCDALFHIYTGHQQLLRPLRNLGMSTVNHLSPLKRWLVAHAREA